MLKCYKNKTPNNNHLHYYFTDFDDYLTELGTPFAEYQLHDYRINENTIILGITEEDANDITYFIDIRNNYKRCYAVDFMNYQNGQAIFNVTVDLWATYIADANISNIRVTRCNRNIGIGTYDKINVTKGTPTYLPLLEIVTAPQTPHTFTPTGILATISFTIRQGDGVNPDVTALKTFYFATTQLTYLTNPTIYDLIDYVSGIFSNNAPAGMFNVAKSQVISAFLIDDYCIDNQYKLTTNLPTFKSYVSTVTGTTSKDIQPLYEVKSHVFTFSTKAINYFAEFDAYVGTRHNQLKIARTTEDNMQVDFEFIFNYNNLQVFVKQGGTSLDITNAFKVTLTTNDGVASGQKHIADAIAIIGSAGAMATGNVFFGTLGLASALNNMTQTNGGISAGGDGACELLLSDCFVLTLYQSTDDELAHARLFGANFNQQIYSLDDIESYSLLGYSSFTESYIKCDAFVDGIPELATNEILSKLNNGIYIKFLPHE